MPGAPPSVTFGLYGPGQEREPREWLEGDMARSESETETERSP